MRINTGPGNDRITINVNPVIRRKRNGKSRAALSRVRRALGG